MLKTGNQLKAGRAIIGMEQSRLAELSGVHINTIRNMEAVGKEPIRGREANRASVQRALETAGVRFPPREIGVALRLLKKSKPAGCPANPGVPAPGLGWSKRAGGRWAAVWYAPRAHAAKGFKPRWRRLWPTSEDSKETAPTTAEWKQISQTSVEMNAAAMAWGRRRK
jgi:hypothetical protein